MSSIGVYDKNSVILGTFLQEVCRYLLLEVPEEGENRTLRVIPFSTLGSLRVCSTRVKAVVDPFYAMACLYEYSFKYHVDGTLTWRTCYLEKSLNIEPNVAALRSNPTALAAFIKGYASEMRVTEQLTECRQLFQNTKQCVVYNNDAKHVQEIGDAIEVDFERAWPNYLDSLERCDSHETVYAIPSFLKPVEHRDHPEDCSRIQNLATRQAYQALADAVHVTRHINVTCLKNPHNIGHMVALAIRFYNRLPILMSGDPMRLTFIEWTEAMRRVYNTVMGCMDKNLMSLLDLAQIQAFTCWFDETFTDDWIYARMLTDWPTLSLATAQARMQPELGIARGQLLKIQDILSRQKPFQQKRQKKY